MARAAKSHAVLLEDYGDVSDSWHHGDESPGSSAAMHAPAPASVFVGAWRPPSVRAVHTVKRSEAAGLHLNCASALIGNFHLAVHAAPPAHSIFASSPPVLIDVGGTKFKTSLATLTEGVPVAGCDAL